MSFLMIRMKIYHMTSCNHEYEGEICMIIYMHKISTLKEVCIKEVNRESMCYIVTNHRQTIKSSTAIYIVPERHWI